MQQLLQDFLQEIPPSLIGMKTEMEQWLKLVFTKKMQAMDFVTREEFDIQRAVLQRTQERCIQLEKQLAALSLKVNERSKNEG
jgi:BMFP domain-containing protein YqiC